MIKAVIFDLGGVLIKNTLETMIPHYEKEVGVHRDKLIPALKPYWHQWERGTITEEELWKKTAADLGVPMPTGKDIWMNGILPSYVENTDVFALIDTLRTKGYKIGLLSNLEPPVQKHVLSRNYAHFDEYIFSCEVGMAKPEPQIYLHAAEKLGIQSNEAVFVDDKPENIEAANNLGMIGVVFTDVKVLHTSLKQILKINSLLSI